MPATEKYGFFDSRDGDERVYSACEFAEYFASCVSNGVFSTGGNLRAYCTGTDRKVRVLPGKAWINGYYYQLRGEELTLELAEADAALDRIDRVVLRLNTDPKVFAIKLSVLQGKPGSEPAAPELVRAENIYDISIAAIRITHNASTVPANAVTDTRMSAELCGIVKSHTHAASDIQAGTLGGKVQANTAAAAALDAAQVRSIRASTADLAAGTAALPSGEVYLVYE